MTKVNDKKSDYKTLIPRNLHKQVDSLIDYLDFFPFEQPKQCPYCGSKSIHFSWHYSRPNQQLGQHNCTNCKRNFNQLTNTIFARSWNLETWGQIGRLYLTGLSSIQIANITGFTKATATSRCKAINRLMEEDYPDLYEWWYNHHIRKDLRYSDIVQQQATYFLQWLHERINQKGQLCPLCSRPMSKRKRNKERPMFVCFNCKIYHSAFEGTRLKKLSLIEYWIPFAERLIDGYTCQDISALTSLKTSTALRWRPTFLAQIKDLGLNELSQWLTWQRRRRSAETKIKKFLAQQ